MFEFALVGRARGQFRALSEDEQREVEAVIRGLEEDPWHDGRRKAEIVVAPLVLSVYDDGRWQLTYRVVDYRFIEIFAITRAI